MPIQHKTSCDWEQAQALFCKGLSLRDISDQMDIPLTALRKRQTRYKWTQRKTELGQAVVKSVQSSLSEHAGAWLTQIDEYVHKVIAKVQPDTLGLKDLAIAVGIAETVDRMARRAYGLDAEQRNRPGTLVHVSVSSAGPQVQQPIAIMDIESEVQSVNPGVSNPSDKSDKPK